MGAGAVPHPHPHPPPLLGAGQGTHGLVWVGLFSWLHSFSPSLTPCAVRADGQNVLEQLWDYCLRQRPGHFGLGAGAQGRPCLVAVGLARPWSPQDLWKGQTSGGLVSSPSAQGCSLPQPQAGPAALATASRAAQGAKGPCPLTSHSTGASTRLPPHARCQARPSCPDSSPTREWFSLSKTCNF